MIYRSSIQLRIMLYETNYFIMCLDNLKREIPANGYEMIRFCEGQNIIILIGEKSIGSTNAI